MYGRFEMNIVFWVLVIFIGIAAWFIMTFAFIPLGRAIVHIWKNTMNHIQEEDNKNGHTDAACNKGK